MSKLYKDRDWLFDQYWNKENSQREIAENAECSRETIITWMKKFNISVRSPSETGKGNKHHSWKGGRYKNRGYFYILKPDHPRSKRGYVLEHIVVAEKMIGRSLKYYGNNNKDNEIIHHIDFNGFNNDPENLHICNSSDHRTIHNKFGGSIKELYELGVIYFDKEKGEYFINYNQIKETGEYYESK